MRVLLKLSITLLLVQDSFAECLPNSISVAVNHGEVQWVEVSERLAQELGATSSSADLARYLAAEAPSYSTVKSTRLSVLSSEEDLKWGAFEAELLRIVEEGKQYRSDGELRSASMPPVSELDAIMSWIVDGVESQDIVYDVDQLKSLKKGLPEALELGEIIAPESKYFLWSNDFSHRAPKPPPTAPLPVPGTGTAPVPTKPDKDREEGRPKIFTVKCFSTK